MGICFGKTQFYLFIFKAGIPRRDLTIALEPEAASVYCMRLPKDMLRGGGQQVKGAAVGPFSKGVKYMVVDIGGKALLSSHFTLPFETTDLDQLIITGFTQASKVLEYRGLS